MDKTLFADTARFPHETIDGETVLVDSELGHCSCLQASGPGYGNGWHSVGP